MIYRILIFLSLFIILLLGINLFIYFSLVKHFNLSNSNLKLFLFWFLFGMVFLFFLSSVGLHFWNNLFLQSLYLIASVWAGFWVYLFFALVFSGIIYFISRIFGIPSRMDLISGLLIVLALLYSIYGLWNARNIRLTELTVKIKNLPAAWQNKTVVQLSDLHLGSIYGRGFMEKIVERTNQLSPEVVFITGDLFDGMDGELESFVEPLKHLKAPKGTYFITGNHEIYLGMERVLSAVKQTSLTMLNDQTVDLDGLQISGIHYGSDAFPRKNIAEILTNDKAFQKGKPTILLYHPPMGIEDAKIIGINLQLSGHTHRGQLFPFGYITSWVFKGYDFGLYTEGDYTLYTTPGIGTWGPPMRTGNHPEIVKIKLVGS